jgi:hypothetical protein
MYSLDLKTVGKVVYRRKNSSVQAKVGHEELTKTLFYLTGLTPLSGFSSVENSLGFSV